MKEHKRRLGQFSFYDRTGIVAYLEKQAEQGWMLERIGGFGWRFRRIEPQRIRFNVVYFPKASAFDPEPSEEQLAFQDFCSQSGWKLAASSAQMQIFYNEAPDPVPIETDAAIEVENIHAAAKKSHLPNNGMLLAVGLLQLGLFLWRLMEDPVGVLASSANLFTGLCSLCLLALSLVEITGYYRWRRKALAAAPYGIFVQTRPHRAFQLCVLACMLAALAFVLLSYRDGRMGVIALVSMALVLCVVFLILGASALMKRWKLSARANRNTVIALTFVFSFGLMGVLLIAAISRIIEIWPGEEAVESYSYQGIQFSVHHDALPLYIEDLMQTEYTGYSCELYAMDASPLAARYTASQRPRMDALDEPDLTYTVTTVRFSPIYGWCRKALLEDFARNYGPIDRTDSMWKEAVPSDPAPWEALEAYQLHMGGEAVPRFLLCYGNCIVEMDFDQRWTLTEAQMRTVAEKLGGV